MERTDPVAATSPSARPDLRRTALWIYLACVLIYAVVMGSARLRFHSENNHFSYLADAYLHGTLSVRCDPALTHGATCPPGGGGNDWARYNSRWFVAFPSFPAVLYMPAVALFGRDFANGPLDALLAGVSPALLYVFLERLAQRGYTRRSWRENAALTALFAFGTVYFYTAVQCSVWFVAHVVGCALGAGFLIAALECKRPLLAGALLGLSFHSRTSTIFAALFFGLEALRVHRLDAQPELAEDASWIARLIAYLRGVDWRPAVKKVLRFSLPLLALIGVYMLLNKLRFDDWRDPGYQYLQIRWQARIQRWGLFNYHYLSRNLAVVLALLPWTTRAAPFVQISRHGLALWFTSPNYLELLRPARTHALAWSFGLTAAVIATVDLLYQNSGWVQFGYRFSNDYALFLIAVLAITGRKVGRTWLVVLAIAIGINLFGALTFERGGAIYQGDNDSNGMFQSD